MTIVTKLSGGLGNQLFQYAAARALGLRLGRPVKGDLSWFGDIPEGSTPRVPLLSHFRLPMDYVDARGCPESLFPSATTLWQAMTRPARILREKRPFEFNPRLASMAQRSRFAYLEGYWQSFRYFEDARRALVGELTPRNPLAEVYVKTLHDIQGSEAVMVHVRRGDYVHSQSAARVHGALPLAYYERALEHVQSRVQRPRLFVFSDDIEWVRAHLRHEMPATYVTSADHETAVIDELMLMRQCRHHVIANSSLSWWGAWLSDAPGKTVIAPRQWLQSDALDLGDLIPANWNLLA